MTHYYDVRVYYHDVDYMGVVYHGHYPRFLEQARTEWFRSHGAQLVPLHDEGVFFAVTQLNIDYKSPAFLDEPLQVATKLVKLGAASLVCEQVILRSTVPTTVVVQAKVSLCCVNQHFKPIRIPNTLRGEFLRDKS